MASDNVFLTALGNGSQTQITGTNRGGGTGDENPVARLRSTLTKLLGGDESLTMTTSQAVDLDAYQGPPRAAMGLQVAVSGRATVVNADVAQHLIEYQDPIKSVLNVSVHRDTRVIVKRKYVRGGPAEVVPERSQARTVSVQEEEHEAILTRYGADIEMSTNLMSSEPALAAEDLKLKLDFQKRVLDERLTEIGYETVMSAGLSLSRALLEHSPQFSDLPEYERARVLDQLQADHAFAFQKYDNAFPNLLATVKRATPVTSGKFDTVILPSGLPDVEKFAKAENTKFFLTGVPNAERERVSFDLNQTFIDVPSGMRVAVTYPKVNNVNGTMRPRLERSGVQRVRAIATFHRITNDAVRIVNLHTGALEKPTVYSAPQTPGGTAPTEGDVIIRPRIRIMTSSMVVAASGCGELLMAYPLTSVSTVATAPEQMRMQLRVFLGAAVFKSEDVVICEDVKSEGVISGGGTRIANTINLYAGSPESYDGFIIRKTGEAQTFNGQLGSKPAVVYGATQSGGGSARSSLFDSELANIINASNFADKLDDGDQIADDQETFPVVVYQGATFKTDGTMVEANTGHLGILDDPKLCKRLSGQNLYTEAPQMVKIV